MADLSIYRTSEGEAKIIELYDQALERLGVEYEEQMLDTQFGPTHLIVTGPENGPPLFVLHGGNATNPLTLAWYLPLADRYRLYAPDMIGHPGKSAQTRLPAGDSSYGRWIVDLMDGLEIERAPFVGVSYGAAVILRTAAYAPERLSKAALHAPAGLVKNSLFRMTFELAFPMFAYRRYPNRERLVKAIQPLTGTRKIDELWLATIGAIFRHVKLQTRLPRPARREELANFQAPTLVIAAEHDLLFPAAALQRRTGEVIPNLVGVECLDGGYHLPSPEELPHIQERISNFLEEAS